MAKEAIDEIHQLSEEMEEEFASRDGGYAGRDGGYSSKGGYYGRGDDWNERRDSRGRYV